MSQDRLVIEQLKITPQETADFTEFYHHEYLPEVLKLPELQCVNRYEEYGTKSSLAWFDQSYLTIYSVSSKAGSNDLFESMLKRLPDTLKSQMDAFRFRFFFREMYELIYSHEGNSSNESFANGPFFIVTVETEGEESAKFHRWYEEEYLPKTMADIPTWIDCKRYKSTQRTPIHYHTIYKARNMDELERGFELLRSPHRYQSNADWDSWVGKAISKQNAATFQQIYHRGRVAHL
ncbi:MAG: hypothetical protein Tsb0021_11220 [Chlamydiales bacterium]